MQLQMEWKNQNEKDPMAPDDVSNMQWGCLMKYPQEITVQKATACMKKYKGG